MSVAQLQLPLLTPPSAGDSGRVWLISAAKPDASALRNSLQRKRRRSPGFVMLDLEDGASKISPQDIILLKTSDRPGLDLFAPPRLLQDLGAAPIISAIEHIAGTPPDASVRTQTIDLGLLRFVGNATRARRAGWVRSSLEIAFDTLHCRAVLANASLAREVCHDVLDEPQLDPGSLLRATALRIEADALVTSGADQEACVRYVEATHVFRSAGALYQAAICRALAKRLAAPHQDQLELWGVPDVERNPRRSFGPHIRRFTGMCLPVPSLPWSPSGPAKGLLDHEHVATVDLDLTHLAKWISGSIPSTRVLSLSMAPCQGGAGRFVDVVVDSELATQAGFAGSAIPHDSVESESYRLIPSSATCDVAPFTQNVAFGRPARFEAKVAKTGAHRISFLALTSDGSPTNVDFVVRF